MASWKKQRERELAGKGDPLGEIPGERRESLFQRVMTHERSLGGAFSVMWISEKDIGKACRDLWASIPTRRGSEEPAFQTDMATALCRGGIRISNTTIKVRP